MDKNTAKQILSAYRPNGADANDENLKDALQLCRNDPQMKRWFENEISADKELTQSMRSINVPQEGKQVVLAMTPFDQPRKKKTLPLLFRRSLPYAAAIGIALLAWQALSRAGRMPVDAQPTSLATFARDALPLQRKSSNIKELDHWLEGQGAPVPAFIPAAISRAAKTAGCRAFDDGNGGKVSLYCFQLDGKLLHVFVYDQQNETFANLPEKEWRRQDGWNFYSWSQGEYTLALASPIDPAILDSIVARI